MLLKANIWINYNWRYDINFSRLRFCKTLMFYLMVLTCLRVSIFSVFVKNRTHTETLPMQLEMMWRFHALPPSISHKEQSAGLNPDSKAMQRPSWCWPYAHSLCPCFVEFFFMFYEFGVARCLCLSICLYFSKVLEENKQWLLCNIWGMLWSSIYLFIHLSISFEFLHISKGCGKMCTAYRRGPITNVLTQLTEMRYLFYISLAKESKRL